VLTLVENNAKLLCILLSIYNKYHASSQVISNIEALGKFKISDEKLPLHVLSGSNLIFALFTCMILDSPWKFTQKKHF